MMKIDFLKGMGLDKLASLPHEEVRFKSERDLQVAPITEKTNFLYYIRRGVNGYETGWVWSESKTDLVDFLLDVLVAKALAKEYEITEANSDGITASGIQESFILAMASSLVNQNLDPNYFAEFSGAVNEISDALNNDTDLNMASVNLMDFTASLFYSLTWSFFGSEEEVRTALSTHSVVTQGDLVSDLLRDNNL